MINDDYYKYLSAWHKECNQLSESLRAEVMGLEADWFKCKEEDLDKARFFEINSRADKLIQPYHHFYGRMLTEEKVNGVGFHNASDNKREDKPKSWREVGSAVEREGKLDILYNDREAGLSVDFTVLTRKRDDYYTGVIEGVRTNFFKQADGKWGVHELS